MDENKTLKVKYEERVNKFLDDFMLDMYKGHDHSIARKYFHDLFNELIPKYFCICEHDKNEIGSKSN
jgi:hypothetical protein